MQGYLTKITFILLLFLSFKSNAQKNNEIIGIHLINYTNDSALDSLAKLLPEFAKKGINTLFLEIDYNFDFKSHPELRADYSYITSKAAKKFSEKCKALNIEIVPQFQAIGHQSWEKNTFSLLTVYPELDLTPGAFKNNEGIYCREWDVTNPRVNEIVFPLILEILEAFDAQGVHLGMDEIFLLDNPLSPNTYGKDPAKLLAKTINEFHDFLSKKHKKQIYIWGDRLIDAHKFGYGKWEASANLTHFAIDLIPKDIIICDWHYNSQKNYPSVDLFLEKGFRVLPCSWNNPEAVKAFIRYSYALKNKNMMGHLFTTWSDETKDLPKSPAINQGLEIIKNKLFDVVYFKIVTNAQNESFLQLYTLNPKLTIVYDENEHFTDPKTYTQEIPFNKSLSIYAKVQLNENLSGEVSYGNFIYHKALYQKISVLTPMSTDYATENREKTLNNGIYETEGYADGEWLGFNGENLEALIEFKESTPIQSVSMNFYNKVNDWVHHPLQIEVLGSNNNIDFTSLNTWKSKAIGKAILNVNLKTTGNYKYLKVIAYNKIIPEGFNGEGKPAWIFVDEIVVK
jgi:hypothetical protein